MGIRPRIRVQSLCFGVATPRVRACAAASSFSSKSTNSNRTAFSSRGGQDYGRGKDDKGDHESGNKVMVVVDSSFEAKGALEWALSHAVQTQDTVVLVHVAKAREDAECPGKFNVKAYQLLLDMKSMCEMKKPGVLVNVLMLEGEEKGAAIVQEAKQQRVSLLVVGQRKRSILWCFLRRWTRKRSSRGGVVEYCIQNSPCMTIAVRRKNKKHGGYLITTKRHKKFWLLA